MASQESAGEQIPAAAENGGMRATPGKSFAVPRWANDAGRWSWITLGLVILLIAFLALLAATRVLVVSALFAVLLGGTFLPLVDALHKRHFPRWLAALLVVVLLIALAVGIALIIIYGVMNQAPEMQQRLDEAQAELQKALNTTSVPQSTLDSAKAGLQELYKSAASGVAGALSSAISNVGTLLFGIFISLNILMWVLIQGRKMGAWASRHMGSVPPPVGYAILANSARFFRGYIWGSTLTGLFNGGVMFVGALIIGVPMAATIGIVGWFTNYIPFFGAIISGAFAVLVALAAGGPSMAIPMLIIVIISNGYLQTLDLAVRSRRDAQAAPPRRALRDHGRQPAVRRYRRRLRGAVPEDRPRRRRTSAGGRDLLGRGCAVVNRFVAAVVA